MKIADRLEIDHSRIILCPGNHDVDRFATEAYESKFPKCIGEKPWDPPKWGGDQFQAYLKVADEIYSKRSGSSVFYRPPVSVQSPSDIFSLHYYPDDQLVVYSLSSCVFESHREQDRFGYVGKEQLDKLDEVIKAFKEKHGLLSLHPLIQVVVVHHPFFAPDDRDPSALRDPFMFMNWLWHHGIHLVLHGHQHYTRTVVIHGRDAGNAPRAFVCAGAGSVGARPQEMIDRRNALNLVRFSGRGFGTRQVTVRPGEFVRASQSWRYHRSEEWHYTLDSSGLDSSTEVKRLGLSKALERLHKTQESILRGEPVTLEGADAAFESYGEAMQKMTKTGELRVTSTLGSQFWGEKLKLQIQQANMAVKGKVGKEKIRRIFFTLGDSQEYIRKRTQLADNERKLSNNDTEWTKLTQTKVNLNFLAQEFEMKVLDCHQFKIAVDGFDPMRDELAIYDFEPGETRIDLFKLDDYGQVLNVVVRAGQSLEDAFRREFVDAFDRAWNHFEAMDVKRYLELAEDEIQRVQSAIGYTTNWLHAFDKLVSQNDKTLTAESDAVAQYLQQRQIQNHLDVGVCTGRYIDLLKTFVSNSAAIDIDCDVENFIRGRFPKLNFKLGDIRDARDIRDMGQDYDLITCMLGTCCHFGLKEEHRYGGQSGLVAGLRNMVGMLSKEGVLLLSVWQKRNANRLLEIYTPKEVDRLLRDSPSEQTIYNAAQEAGAGNVRKLAGTGQLDLYTIERQ